MRPLLPALLVVVCAAGLAAQSSSSFSRADFRAAAAPRAIALADFNRDGWIDTATSGTGPVNYIEYGLHVDPTQTYKLWLRLKADRCTSSAPRRRCR